jgi:glycosyltransferase involved in cell wall biosynthesis
MKKKVIVKAPALSATGYGEHARFVLRALRANEDKCDIYLHNLDWGKASWLFEDSEERRWMDELIKKTSELLTKTQGKANFDLSVQVTIPNEFEKIAQKNIGVTAGIETTKIAHQWIQKSNEMDKVVVVSNHAKFGFENTKYPLQDENQNHVADLKCSVPVEVVGYPVRTFEPAKIDLELETDFNFLVVALWSQRKNMERTVLNFLEEFKDEEVGLVLKTSIKSGCTYDKLHTENMLNSMTSKFPDRKCKVYLLHGRMTEEEMTALYQHDKIKCMLSLAHGEGFGLPIFEAAGLGLPIVATDWSGHTDFLYMPQKDKKGKTKNKGMFGKVSYDLRPVQKGSHWEGVVTPDSMWAYPSDASAKSKMRNVFKDYNLALSKAKKLKEHVQQEFASDKMHSKMFSSLISQEEQELHNDINDMFAELGI